MINFYISAVKFGYMQIEDVPHIYIEQVKEALGITE